MPDMHWRMIGPFRGGRTRAAAGVPDQPDVFYVGQVDGGVWKSTDDGRTGDPIFDGQDTQSIGAIAVAPSDSNVVYVASGEGASASASIFPSATVSIGQPMPEKHGRTLACATVSRFLQLPSIQKNPNRVFAAVLGHPYGPNAERGIFRSTDGGKTWEKGFAQG